jgi:hypothetical protein
MLGMIQSGQGLGFTGEPSGSRANAEGSTLMEWRRSAPAAGRARGRLRPCPLADQRKNLVVPELFAGGMNHEVPPFYSPPRGRRGRPPEI